MAKIFLSYARENRPVVEKVRSILEEHGHEIWFDNDILLGNPFPQAIEVGIESCDFFAIFLTKEVIDSSWVKRELTTYFLKDMERGTSTILPLKFDETDIRDFGRLFAPIQHCDFTQNFETGINDLLKRVGSTKTADGPSEEDYKRLLFSIDLVVTAGNAAMMYYNSSLKQNQALDDRRNAATRADTTAQNKILHLINMKYENEEIISEEIHKDNPRQEIKSDGYTWVIDPLDGTNNFVNRIPFFCSAIGILKHGKPFIGTIFDPVLNEVYFAIQGQQSKIWKISTGETVSISTDPQRKLLDQALIATHISSREDIAQRLFANEFFLNMSKKFKHIRAFGCGQLALAYVASGRLQAFLQLDSYIWDQVAGVVILNNAGGITQGFDLDTHELSDWSYKTRNILACSNKLILDAFQAEFMN